MNTTTFLIKKKTHTDRKYIMYNKNNLRTDFLNYKNNTDKLETSLWFAKETIIRHAHTLSQSEKNEVLSPNYKKCNKYAKTNGESNVEFNNLYLNNRAWLRKLNRM